MINTDPNHKHTYDTQGHMTCCSLEGKINSKTEHHHDHDGHDHDHDHEGESAWKALLDIRPDTVNVIRNGATQMVSPSEITVGETSQDASFITEALEISNSLIR